MDEDLVVQNADLGRLIRETYRRQDLERIEDFLRRHRTLEIQTLENGLSAASPEGGSTLASGYQNVWIRDTVYVAHSRRVQGDVAAAQRTAATLIEYFRRHARRIDEVLQGRADPSDPMQRPHVRFDGVTLAENREPWPHAQNDALGYALWLCGSLHREGWPFPAGGADVLAGLVLFLQSIEYWQDEDSGHWEEDRALHLSSVGTVVAGLRAIRTSLDGPITRASATVDAELLKDMESRGLETLARLPAESPPVPATDAALLFLIEPLDVIDDERAGAVLAAVREQLEGPYGIKRYMGDSYWCADYRELYPAELRSTNFSQDIGERDGKLVAGTEAQWCIFDPMISAYYGRRFARTRDLDDRARQLLHLNRALGQITGDDCPQGPGRCPEAYFMESSNEGIYRPNDQTPLAWTQANLAIALQALRNTLTA